MHREGAPQSRTARKRRRPCRALLTTPRKQSRLPVLSFEATSRSTKALIAHTTKAIATAFPSIERHASLARAHRAHPKLHTGGSARNAGHFRRAALPRCGPPALRARNQNICFAPTGTRCAQAFSGATHTAAFGRSRPGRRSALCDMQTHLNKESTLVLRQRGPARLLMLEQSVNVHATVGAVFEAIVDQTKLPGFTRWHGVIPKVARVDVSPSGYLHVGSHRRMIFAKFGGYSEVIELLERSGAWCRMDYRVTGGFPFPVSPFASGGCGRYEVTAASFGCVATWSAWVDLRSDVAIPFAHAFKTLFVHRAMHGYLKAVAQFCERETS